jgi:hypothetical protein
VLFFWSDRIIFSIFLKYFYDFKVHGCLFNFESNFFPTCRRNYDCPKLKTKAKLCHFTCGTIDQLLLFLQSCCMTIIKWDFCCLDYVGDTTQIKL